jgi:hypothetical protein
MVTIRRTAWFFALAIVMAGWMGVLGSFRGMAEAGMIASHGGAGDLRASEIAKVQTFLEQSCRNSWITAFPPRRQWPRSGR